VNRNEKGFNFVYRWAMMNKVQSLNTYDLKCLVCGISLDTQEKSWLMEDHIKGHIEKDEIKVSFP
jgi:predicted restriction endonuclease